MPPFFAFLIVIIPILSLGAIGAFLIYNGYTNALKRKMIVGIIVSSISLAGLIGFFIFLMWQYAYSIFSTFFFLLPIIIYIIVIVFFIVGLTYLIMGMSRRNTKYMIIGGSFASATLLIVLAVVIVIIAYEIKIYL